MFSSLSPKRMSCYKDIVSSVWFCKMIKESCATQKRPTKRAADGWESARFSSFFLASGFFYISSLFPARPPAANANRWAGTVQKCFVGFVLDN